MIRSKTSASTSSFFAVVASIPLFMAFALHGAAAQEIDDTNEIETFINASMEACRLDALEYCGNIAPGDGQLGQCLKSLGASLSEKCASALDALSTATVVVPDRFSNIYPTLEHRELGNRTSMRTEKLWFGAEHFHSWVRKSWISDSSCRTHTVSQSFRPGSDRILFWITSQFL